MIMKRTRQFVVDQTRRRRVADHREISGQATQPKLRTTIRWRLLRKIMLIVTCVVVVVVVVGTAVSLLPWIQANENIVKGDTNPDAKKRSIDNQPSQTTIPQSLPSSTASPFMVAFGSEERLNNTANDNSIPTIPFWIMSYVKYQNQSWLPSLVSDQSIANSSRTSLLRQFLSNTSTTRPRILVWRCPAKGVCGGLGDRLYGMIMGYFMALLSNRLYFIQEWSWSDGDDDDHAIHTLWDHVQPSHLYYHNLAWTVKDNALPLRTLSTLDNRNHRLLLNPCALQTDTRDYFLHNNIMVYDTQLRQSSCLHEYWKQHHDERPEHPPSDSTTMDHRPLVHLGFWTLFRFTKRVEEQAQELLRQSGIMTSKQQQQQHQSADATATSPMYIAMHVRTGPGQTWNDPNRHGGMANLERFHDCAVRVQKAVRHRCGDRQLDVYVAADQAHAKAFFVDKHSSHGNDNPFKANPKMQVFHIDRTNTELLSNVTASYDQVWGELKVLMDASCLIMSHSKFSTLAMELSLQQPRCALYFDECSQSNVEPAVNALLC